MSDNPKDPTVPMYAGVPDGWRPLSLAVGIVFLVVATNSTKEHPCPKQKRGTTDVALLQPEECGQTYS